ncbi:MAG: DUF2336 domain-containing protein [Ancalomicrobiaceae bacterium]|nr:DUF2336 domain-containing protein [Ancalomicrobiaceae bacterium]
MSMEKLLQRIAMTPSADPSDDLRQLRQAFVRCSGRMGPAEVGCFVEIAGQLLPRAPLIQRIAFARPLATSHTAPKPIVSQLALDNHMVSAAILERSPLIGEDELVGILKAKGRAVRLAIAKRPGLSVGLTDLVMDAADLPVCRALATNRSARVSRKNLARLVDVARDDDMTRAALGLRRDLPSGLAAQLSRIDAGAADHPRAATLPHDTGFGLGRAGFVMTRRLVSAQQARRPPQVLSYS